MKKIYLGGGLVLVLLILIKIAISIASHPSDQQQIQQALAESLQASKNGKAGGVMDLLGKQISFNSEDASGQLGQVAQFIKNQRPDVTVQNQTAQISGDDAQISSPVTIDVSLLGQHKTVNLKQVLLSFHRENATDWLVIPTKKWKLEQVQVPNFSPDQLSQ